jgi:hypothetical protein
MLVHGYLASAATGGGVLYRKQLRSLLSLKFRGQAALAVLVTAVWLLSRVWSGLCERRFSGPVGMR